MRSHFDFATKWVEGTWQDGFRFGFLTFDGDTPQRIALGDRVPDLSEQIEPESERFRSRIFQSVSAGQVDVEEARRAIEKEGLSPFLIIATTKEELIAGIACILDRGANVRASGGEYSWRTDGTFAEVFWHDPSHPVSS